jgi:general secretion pathway protein F
MPAFEYKALNATGGEVTGVEEADTPKQLRQQLRSRNLTPLQVSEVSVQAKQQSQSWWRNKRNNNLSFAELTLFTRQLATLLDAGTPLEEALAAVAEQNETPRVKSLLVAVRARVLEGHTLSHALGDFPRAFPELYRASVHAGEQSGHLGAVLTELADYVEEQQILRQKLKQAAIYPLVMCSVSIAIVTFLLVQVVPQIVGVFKDAGQVLPLETRILIGISHGLVQYGLYILAVVLLTIIAFQRSLKQLSVRRNFHEFLLRTPLVGRVLKLVNTARFCRTLSILLASSVPVVDAMRLAAGVITLVPPNEAVLTASSRVREGASLSVALKQTRYFQPMSLHLIASGETSGQLAPMLARAARNQDRDVQSWLATGMSLFEPALILVMGGIVLFIVLAIMLPIFDMNQMVS